MLQVRFTPETLILFHSLKISLIVGGNYIGYFVVFLQELIVKNISLQTGMNLYKNRQLMSTDLQLKLGFDTLFPERVWK